MGSVSDTLNDLGVRNSVFSDRFRPLRPGMQLVVAGCLGLLALAAVAATAVASVAVVEVLARGKWMPTGTAPVTPGNRPTARAPAETAKAADPSAPEEVWE